jgi:hypothetical protein
MSREINNKIDTNNNIFIICIYKITSDKWFVFIHVKEILVQAKRHC